MVARISRGACKLWPEHLIIRKKKLCFPSEVSCSLGDSKKKRKKRDILYLLDSKGIRVLG